MPQLTLPYISALGNAYNQKHDANHTYATINQSEDKLNLYNYDIDLINDQQIITVKLFSRNDTRAIRNN